MKNKKAQRIRKTNKKQYTRRKKEKRGAIYKKQYLWYIFFKNQYTKSNTRKGNAYEKQTKSNNTFVSPFSIEEKKWNMEQLSKLEKRSKGLPARGNGGDDV